MSKTQSNAGPGDRQRRYAAALKLLPEKSRKMPADLERIAGIRAALWAVPTGTGGLAELLTTSSPETFDADLDRVAAEVGRRTAAAALIAGGAAGVLERDHKRALTRFLPELVERLRPTFDKAAAALAAAAPSLPAGPRFDDPATVLAAGAENHHRAAVDAVEVLRTIAAVHTVPAQALRGAGVLALVEPPTRLASVGMHAATRQPVDRAAADRAAVVERLLRAYDDDPRLCLVDLARGAFPGCRLDLAADAAAMTARVDAVTQAHRRHTVAPAAVVRPVNPQTAGMREIIERGTGIDLARAGA